MRRLAEESATDEMGNRSQDRTDLIPHGDHGGVGAQVDGEGEEVHCDGAH